MIARIKGLKISQASERVAVTGLVLLVEQQKYILIRMNLVNEIMLN